MRTLSLLLLAAILSLTSCQDFLDQVEDQETTEEDIVNGLKTALRVGTDSSSTKLASAGGYYLDEAVKIYLPPEAAIITEHKDNEILQAIGITQLIDTVILTMNKAAEDAAKKAQPIFVDAITSMTIADGVAILQGKDTAATHYLKENTYENLQEAYKPDVQNALEKDLVGNTSTQEAWNKLTTEYNNVANTAAGTLLGLEPVNVELNEYVTRKALDGLFLKIAKEEAEIRADPYQWSLDILHRIFG